MVALAYSMLADRDLAEDVAQDVFVIACRGLARLKQADKFAAWLAGICRNTAKQALRAADERTPLLSGHVREGCGDDEHRQAIRRAVWNLRPGEREVVVMRYFDGLSQQRIAEVLNLTPQAVNGRLVRAKRKVARYLKRNGFQGDDHESLATR